MKEDTLKNTLERIGAKLTELRKEKGYTSHEDFAYDYEIPRVQYWRMKKGKTNFTIKSLCRLLAIRKITIENSFASFIRRTKNKFRCVCKAIVSVVYNADVVLAVEFRTTAGNDFFLSVQKYVMNSHILPKLEKKIKEYQSEHRGEMPLYILVPSHEADGLMDEVRQADGYDADTLVTTYKGSKIVKHDSLNKGSLMLTNDLPETSS